MQRMQEATVVVGVGGLLGLSMTKEGGIRYERLSADARGRRWCCASAMGVKSCTCRVDLCRGRRLFRYS
jgi:hypothetical protein